MMSYKPTIPFHLSSCELHLHSSIKQCCIPFSKIYILYVNLVFSLCEATFCLFVRLLTDYATYNMSTSSTWWSSSASIWSAQILSSKSSALVWSSILQNHGGVLNWQQVLVGPHPAPSHRGSSSYKCVRETPGQSLQYRRSSCFRWQVEQHDSGVPEYIGAGTSDVGVKGWTIFVLSTHKGPDVLSGACSSACEWNTINVIGLYIVSIPVDLASSKGIRRTSVVGNDPTTHSRVWDTTRWIKGSVTRRTFSGSATGPEGILILSASLTAWNATANLPVKAPKEKIYIRSAGVW